MWLTRGPHHPNREQTVRSLLGQGHCQVSPRTPPPSSLRSRSLHPRLSLGISLSLRLSLSVFASSFPALSVPFTLTVSSGFSPPSPLPFFCLGASCGSLFVSLRPSVSPTHYCSPWAIFDPYPHPLRTGPPRLSHVYGSTRGPDTPPVPHRVPRVTSPRSFS